MHMADFKLAAFADEAAEDLMGQIEALKRNHISMIEIRNVDGRCIIDFEEDALREIKKQLDENDIQVWSIGSPIGKVGITEDFEEHKERFARTLHTAKLLGTKRIRMFSFFIPANEKPDAYTSQVLDRLSVLLDMAEEAGVWCCHENEKEIFGDVGERSLFLHQKFPDRLKGIFDPANYVQCHNQPLAIFDSLLPYLDYLHIKDAMLSDGSVVPAGQGDGDIPAILARFYEKDAGKTLTVEPHLTIFAGFQNLRDDSLKHKFSYASQGEAFDAAVAALKTILDKLGYTYA